MLFEVIYTANLKDLVITGSGQITEAGVTSKGFHTLINIVLIQDQIDSIADNSFTPCTNLRKVTITTPTLNVIGKNVFYRLGFLNTVILGPNITEIGEYCFSSTKIAAITIPKSCKTLYDRIFQSCAALRTVNFEEGINLRTIPIAFLFGSGITSFTIPPSVVVLKDAALQRTSITSIHIPASVTTIEEGCLTYCESLVTITSDSPSFIVKNNQIYTSSSVLYISPGGLGGEMTLPAGITHISKNCFTGAILLTKVSGQDVTVIEKFGFRTCTSLKEVVFPNLQSIGDNAFEKCNLSTFTFTPAINSVGLGVFAGIVDIVVNVSPNHPTIEKDDQDGFIYFKKSLTELTMVFAPYNIEEANIRETVSIIPQSFFEGYPLKRTRLPSTLTIINPYAYRYSGLESIKIPKAVTSLQYNSLSSCPNLTKVEFESDSELVGMAYSVFLDNPSLTLVDFGNMQKFLNMRYSQFQNCVNLKSLNLPKSLKVIEYRSFQSTGLESLLIEGENIDLGVSLCENCKNLHTLTINTQVIGLQAFRNIPNVKTVIFGEKVSEIGTSSFENCPSLETISFDNSVNLLKIGSLAFTKCGCINVVLPTLLNDLFPNAFAFSPNLLSIKFKNDQNSKYSSVSDLIYLRTEGNMIICPSGKSQAIVQPGTRAIKEMAFYGCIKLREVDLGASLIEIEKECFYQCSLLEMVRIPDLIKKIGVDAFKGCDLLGIILFCGNSTQDITCISDPFPSKSIVLVKSSYIDDHFVKHKNLIKSTSMTPEGCPIKPSDQFTKIGKNRKREPRMIFFVPCYFYFTFLARSK